MKFEYSCILLVETEKSAEEPPKFKGKRDNGAPDVQRSIFKWVLATMKR